MNYKKIGWLLSLIIGVEAIFMLPPLFISLYDGAMPAVHGFIITLALMLAVVGALQFTCRDAKTGFHAREGLVCVGISWIAISVLGCLPFYISREIPHFIDAVFEMVSGFTTTGASILNNVEGMSRGLLYWRSFSHWLGGMGILVFLLAVVPISGRNDGFAVHLLRAESPGPSVNKLVPRMKQTALILYLLYIGLTVLNVVFLLLGKMPLFDALCTAFGTAGTGGFGIKNDSMAGYSPYIQNVCTVFMLLFGVNFSCYYLVVMRRFRDFFKDEELRMYFGIVLASIGMIAWNLRGLYPSVGKALHEASFQVASIMTTTGFATANFDLWPSFSKAILLFLMIVGASAGSTGGGIKVSRVLLLLRVVRRNVRQVLHPNKVQTVRVNGQPVDEKVLDNTTAYLSAYVIIIIFSFILLSLDGFSLETDLSAVLACFNNIGPGLDIVGPASNYAGYSDFSKLVLIGDMLAGRLEIFPILVLFSRSTWKRL